MASSVNPPENALFSTETSDGETTHFICQSSGRLTEETFEDGWDAPLPVGSAKAGTNGCYVLLGEGQRTIYCQGEDDILKDYVFDPDDWEWKEGRLAQLRVQAAPGTSLAAINTAKGYIEVFFESSSGMLQSISAGEGGSWKFSTNLPNTNPLPGASIYAITANAVPHVFYAHRDCSIHELVLRAGKWSDEIIVPTAGNSPKSEIFATVREDSDYTLQFCDENGTLFVLAEGALVEVGTVTDNGFKMNKDAQNTRFGTQARTKLVWKQGRRRQK